MSKALDHGLMFVAGGKRTVGFDRLILPPESHHTLFLMLDRPRDGRIGEAFDLDIVQTATEKKIIMGGLDLRIELHKEPDRKEKQPSTEKATIA